MTKGLYRIERIHKTVLRGNPLLLLPEGLLVRWPERVELPAIGDSVGGVAVFVPPHLHETVMTLLFDASPLARCDAARQLARNKETRKRVLERIYSRSFVQQVVATAERLEPEIREQIEAMGEIVSLRSVLRVGSSPMVHRSTKPTFCSTRKTMKSR